MSASPTHCCAYEDRLSHAIGFKLLLLSLSRHMPGAIIHTFENPLVESLKGWMKRQQIVVRIHPTAQSGRGWSIKPILLGYLLEQGLPNIAWIDADVIVLRPFDRYLAKHGSSVIATEEPRRPFDPNAGRAQVWGDTVNRTLSSSLNSAFVRLSSKHLPLVNLWRDRLNDARYLDAQNHSAATRPPALFGDQDVLEGILVGRFANQPLTLMKQGAEIIQDFWMHDYSIRDRLRNAFRLQHPMLLHGQSLKPWDLRRPGAEPHPLTEYREVGSYAVASRPYQHSLEEPDSSYWLFPSSTQGRMINFLTAGSPHLGGAALAFRDHSHHSYRRWRGWCWGKIKGAVSRRS